MCFSSLDDKVLDERTFDARDRFADVFDLLLAVRGESVSGDACVHSERDTGLAAAIQFQMRDHDAVLSALPRHSQYSRHVIGTDENWIGFICRWEADAVSRVHGHPSFAFYQVIRGDFSMDLYKATSGSQAEWTSSRKMTAGDCIWRQGETGRYDNLIHRVSNGGQDGYTLHLFSENPSLGLGF